MAMHLDRCCSFCFLTIFDIYCIGSGVTLKLVFFCIFLWFLNWVHVRGCTAICVLFEAVCLLLFMCALLFNENFIDPFRLCCIEPLEHKLH